MRALPAIWRVAVGNHSNVSSYALYWKVEDPQEPDGDTEKVLDSRTEVLKAGPRDHIVLFYADDGELTQKVGDFLIEAIRTGGAAIVVSTWEHKLAFGRRLAQAGIDLAAARAAGIYTELDAAETIGRFVIGDRADAASFWAEITPAIRRAAGLGQPVRIFGEMVSLLWDTGLVSTAVEVEAMWNELGVQFPFALVCGYPLKSVTDGNLRDPLTDVCRAHSAVAGDPPPSMRGWRF
jgi:MEDS: MEthanogen/methylotroph, DcmR Sensory domain